MNPTPGPDGLPATDLFIGLAEGARWVGGAPPHRAASRTAPDIPTEEVFTTPHDRRRARLCPHLPPDLPDAPARSAILVPLEAGVMVDGPAVGADVLEQLLAIDGTEQLGEVSLVDAGSPILERAALL